MAEVRLFLFAIPLQFVAASVTAIVLLPKEYQVKIGDQYVDHGDYAHPLGAWGQAVAANGGRRNCARDWRGAKRPRQRRNPRKARFSAQPKMRPNEVLPESHIFVNSLQVEAL
jgi:hypothetical protein